VEEVSSSAKGSLPSCLHELPPLSRKGSEALSMRQLKHGGSHRMDKGVPVGDGEAEDWAEKGKIDNAT
jgi:hypothetical protein